VLDTFSHLWKKIQRLWRRNAEPQDPYAGVRVPLKRGPHGRSSPVALAEPEEDGFLGIAARIGPRRR
jgi:hypothetical protein